MKTPRSKDNNPTKSAIPKEVYNLGKNTSTAKEIFSKKRRVKSNLQQNNEHTKANLTKSSFRRWIKQNTRLGPLVKVLHDIKMIRCLKNVFF